MKYADGRKINQKRRIFIDSAVRERNVSLEKKRLRASYAKHKREKATGHKIVGGAPTEEIIVGPHGKQTKVKRIGVLETYVRYGYLTRRRNGSDGPASRGAVVLTGGFTLRRSLELTNPDSFFYGWLNMGVRADIISGELELLPGSGIHYQMQRRGKDNGVWQEPDTERRIEERDMLNVQ
jgi:hypothetical protein